MVRVEAKSYEIAVEEFGRKLKGRILERCRWIRLGESGLRSLPEGVEERVKGGRSEGWSSGWG